jgi:ribosomal protein L28
MDVDSARRKELHMLIVEERRIIAQSLKSLSAIPNIPDSLSSVSRTLSPSPVKTSRRLCPNLASAHHMLERTKKEFPLVASTQALRRLSLMHWRS